MDIPALWLHLDADTREWLVAHNGESLPTAILSALALANGGSVEPAWFSEDDDGSVLTDDAIDWIESVANDEKPPDGTSR